MVCIAVNDVNTWSRSYDDEVDKVKERREKWCKFTKRTFSLCLKACVALGVVSVFIPSKSTMYAIAVSEMGERVLKSEQVQGVASDATKALQIWIKKQIDTETKEKSK